MLAAAVARGVRQRAATDARSSSDWSTLLSPAPVRRLRAVLVVDARDCAATLSALELFARPDVAGVVGSVTLLVRDGRDSLARYADARLTAAVHVAVVPVPVSFRPAVVALGPGPRLLLVDPAGRVVWATRVDAADAAAPTLARAVLHVTDHYLATELATSRPQP
jgi:hypothetical protein